MTSKRLIRSIATFLRLTKLTLEDWRAAHVIVCVKRASLTFLSAAALIDLYDAVSTIERRQITGIFIEAGCALGGSALVITAAKSPQRPFYIYDTFEMIPPPSERDGLDAHRRYQKIITGQAKGPGNTLYYGYLGDLLPRVKATFTAYGFTPAENHLYFIKGLFQETIHLTDPIALAHIDGDWYDSVMVCLERIVPNLQHGGVLIIDDYESWSGCRRAVDEFFHKRHGFKFQMKTRLHIWRV
jgi:hypothetical protein